MTSDLLVIVVLLGVIIALIAERHIFVKQVQTEKDKLLDELSKAIKAVISKNANDYVMTTAIDKVPQEDKPLTDPDLVAEESLSDDEFMQAINKDVAKPS